MNRTGSCFAMFLQKRFSLVFFRMVGQSAKTGCLCIFCLRLFQHREDLSPGAPWSGPPEKKHIISHHKCNSHHWWVSTDSSLLTDGQCPISVGYHLGYPLLSMLVHYYPLLSIPNDSIRVCCSEIDFTSHSHVLLGYNFQIHPQVPNAASIRGLCLKMVCIPTNGQLITIFHGRNEVSVASNFGGVKSSFPRDFQV